MLTDEDLGDVEIEPEPLTAADLKTSGATFEGVDAAEDMSNDELEDWYKAVTKSFQEYIETRNKAVRDDLKLHHSVAAGTNLSLLGLPGQFEADDDFAQMDLEHPLVNQLDLVQVLENAGLKDWFLDLISEIEHLRDEYKSRVAEGRIKNTQAAKLRLDTLNTLADLKLLPEYNSWAP